MSKFLETYGVAIFTLVLVAILIAFAGPLGIKIKEYTLEKAKQIEQIGNKEIENRNPKNYEAVDVEKSWTETHTNSYFFERVSSDKTNADYNKWKSNNKGKNSTSAISTFTIETSSETEYSFDWTVSSESNYDKLTITCNGTTIVNKESGTKNGTEKITLKSGTNTIQATYSKDSSGSRGDDCAIITLPNVKVSVCKNNQTGEISNHIYDKGKITKEPTCTENGEKLFTCKNCGKTKTEMVKKLGHTCTIVGEKCNRCDYVLTIDDLPAVDQVYCIYYDDGEMTISQNEIEPETGRTVVKKGFYDTPSSCTMQMTTVRFVEAVKPKSCGGWFADYSGGCYNLKEIKNIENLYTNECTNMYKMFSYCKKLTSLDLSGFDTSKVTNMSNMFYYCSSLTNLDLSGFNTEKVTNMDSMFASCSNLTSLDVSGFNTENVTDMSDIFAYCKNLTSLDLSRWKTGKVTTMSEMFENCESLISLDLSKFNTSNVINMYEMFYFCPSLTNLDVSGWKTEKVTTMYGMFYNCKNLTSLNISGWNTRNVTIMSRMFEYCNSLTSLDLSKFNTSNVKDIDRMFFCCYSLTNLDVSNFDTSKVKNMSNMFYDCHKLTSLNLSEWNTEKVTNMHSMFNGCLELTSIDVSNFDTSNVTDMSYIFNQCYKLKSIKSSQTVQEKILNSESNACVPSGVTWTITN